MSSTWVGSELANALAYCGLPSMMKKTSCIKLFTVLAGCQKKPNLQRHQGGDHLPRQTRKTRFDARPDLATLGHFGPHWATLGHFGPLWATLGHFGPLWATLGHFGPLWATVGYVLATFGQFFANIGPLFCQFLKITKLYNKTFAGVINSVSQ
jgi:hypothetical protein